MIARLSLVSEIELVSRWASMQYKGVRKDVKAIGEELGARYIIGGSVRRAQDSVRITVQLVDVVTNRQVWGDTYKGKLDDIFEIQEQVAKQIVEALKLKLSFTEKLSLTKRQTVNVQAYDFYLRGQEYLYRLTKRSVEYAIQLFEKAIELDPRYAAAYAACSSAYGQMYQYFSRHEQYRDKAQEFSFKALDVRQQPAGGVCRDGAVLFHLGQARRGRGVGPQGHRAGSGQLHRLLDARADQLHDRKFCGGAAALPESHRHQAGILCRPPGRQAGL